MVLENKRYKTTALPNLFVNNVYSIKEIVKNKVIQCKEIQCKEMYVNLLSSFFHSKRENLSQFILYFPRGFAFHLLYFCSKKMLCSGIFAATANRILPISKIMAKLMYM